MPLLGAQNQATLTAFLRRVASTLPKPKAILLATAHWESHRVLVSTAAQPPMLYDYYGFPPEAYELTYRAPGSPEVAARAIELLRCVPRDHAHACAQLLLLACWCGGGGACGGGGGPIQARCCFALGDRTD